MLNLSSSVQEGNPDPPCIEVVAKISKYPDHDHDHLVDSETYEGCLLGSKLSVCCPDGLYLRNSPAHFRYETCAQPLCGKVMFELVYDDMVGLFSHRQCPHSLRKSCFQYNFME